jgi:hypothetical protein
VTLWTPGGEHRVEREQPPAPEPGPGAAAGGDDDAERAAFEAEMAAAREQLESLPAGVVVAQLTLQLYELAAIHLARTPPALDQAQVAIDAMAAVVERVGSRLEDAEATLRQGLTQLQAAFVQLAERERGQSGRSGDLPPDAPEPRDAE